MKTSPIFGSGARASGQLPASSSSSHVSPGRLGSFAAHHALESDSRPAEKAPGLKARKARAAEGKASPGPVLGPHPVSPEETARQLVQDHCPGHAETPRAQMCHTLVCSGLAQTSDAAVWAGVGALLTKQWGAEWLASDITLPMVFALAATRTPALRDGAGVEAVGSLLKGAGADLRQFVRQVLDLRARDAYAALGLCHDVGLGLRFDYALRMATRACDGRPETVARLLQRAMVPPASISLLHWRTAVGGAQFHAMVVGFMAAPGSRDARRDRIVDALLGLATVRNAEGNSLGFCMAGLGPVNGDTAARIVTRVLDAPQVPAAVKGLMLWGLQINGGKQRSSVRSFKDVACDSILCASYVDPRFQVAGGMKALMAAVPGKRQFELLQCMLSARAASLIDFEGLAEYMGDDPALSQVLRGLQRQFDEVLCTEIAKISFDCDDAQLIDVAHRYMLGEARKATLHNPADEARLEELARQLVPEPPGMDHKHTGGTPPDDWLARKRKTAMLGMGMDPTHANALAALPSDSVETWQKVELLQAGWVCTAPNAVDLDVLLTEYEKGSVKVGRGFAGAPMIIPNDLLAAILQASLMRGIHALSPTQLARGRMQLLALQPAAAAVKNLDALYEAFARAHGLRALLHRPKPQDAIWRERARQHLDTFTREHLAIAKTAAADTILGRYLVDWIAGHIRDLRSALGLGTDDSACGGGESKSRSTS